MTEQGLLDAFNDCLDRINGGQGIDACLRLYPQYAAALRPMLEVGRLVERAQVNAFEVESAQARVRARMSARLSAPPRRTPVVARYALLAASLVLALVAVLGMAESSLPGDSLYSVKQISEGVRSAVTGDQFASRRLDEARILLALKRAANVTFVGDVERIDNADWTVAGLALSVPLGTSGAATIAVSDSVRVDAETTADGLLIARSITLLQQGDLPPTSTPAAFTATLAPTATLTATASPTPSATPVTPSPSATTPPAPTATLPTTTPAPTRSTATPLLCAPTQPAGWITYIVQSGDAVAALASRTGTTVEEVVAVNCLPNSLMILIGDSLFLPSQPPAPAATQPAATLAPQPQPTVDDHGGDDDNSGSGSSNSGSSNSGSGNSGSGNSGSGGGSDDSGGDDHGGSGGDD